jgi:hypothetical protein
MSLINFNDTHDCFQIIDDIISTDFDDLLNKEIQQKEHNINDYIYDNNDNFNYILDTTPLDIWANIFKYLDYKNCIMLENMLIEHKKHRNINCVKEIEEYKFPCLNTEIKHDKIYRMSKKHYKYLDKLNFDSYVTTNFVKKNDILKYLSSIQFYYLKKTNIRTCSHLKKITIEGYVSNLINPLSINVSYFNNVTELTLKGIIPINLDKLQNLVKLECDAYYLRYIPKLPNLKFLDCSNTQVINVTHLTTLTSLICIETQIEDISTLVNLDTLICHDSSIKDIYNNTKLKFLYCNDRLFQKLIKQRMSN